MPSFTSQVPNLQAIGPIVEVRIAVGSAAEAALRKAGSPINKEVTLSWDYPPDLPVVKTDASKLKPILRNLINNAFKFTPRGNITISVLHFPETETVEFKVADTGIGIPKESLPIIFDMFRQLDSSETRSFGGVGLGLYIVRKFIDVLAGKIEVESEPGKGATFTVTIPVKSTRHENEAVLLQG